MRISLEKKINCQTKSKENMKYKNKNKLKPNKLNLSFIKNKKSVTLKGHKNTQD